MREILFRGKRKDNNEWVYGGIVHQTDFYGDECDRWFIIDGTDTQDYDIGYNYEVIRETVAQFTGLYDKNNVRIFEGDIIKTKYGRICIVVWFSHKCCFDLKPIETDENINHKAPDKFDLWYKENLEVV